MRTGEPLIECVVSAVAEKRGISEEALPPVSDSIEPDALEELFEHSSMARDTELLVPFSYAG
jgi:hypothetical protein